MWGRRKSLEGRESQFIKRDKKRTWRQKVTVCGFSRKRSGQQKMMDPSEGNAFFIWLGLDFSIPGGRQAKSHVERNKHQRLCSVSYSR